MRPSMRSCTCSDIRSDSISTDVWKSCSMALPLNGARLIPALLPSTTSMLSLKSASEKKTLTPEPRSEDAAEAVFHFWYQWSPMTETTTLTSMPERADSFRKLYMFSSGTRYGSDSVIDSFADFIIATYPSIAGLESSESGPEDTICTTVSPEAAACSTFPAGSPLAKDQSARKRTSSLDAAGASKRAMDCSPAYAMRPSIAASTLRFLKRKDTANSGSSLLWKVETLAPAPFRRLTSRTEPGMLLPRRTLTSRPSLAFSQSASTSPGAASSSGSLWISKWRDASAARTSATRSSELERTAS